MKYFFKAILTLLCILFPFFMEAQSMDEISRIQSEISEVQNDSVKIKLFAKLANIYWDTKPDSSYSYLTKRIELAIASNNQFQIAKGNESLGVWLLSNGEYLKSIQVLQTSLNLFKDLNDTKNVAYLYSSLGYAHLSAYETNTAIDYYIKSLKMFRDLNDENGISDLYNEIGNLFYSQKNYEEAKCYFQDGLAIEEKLQDTLGISTFYTSIANVVSEQKKYELGLDYYSKALALSEAVGDEYGASIIYNNMGDTFLRIEEYNKAQDYFRKAYEIVKNTYDPEFEAIINLSRGEGYLLAGNYDAAIYYSKKALVISKDRNILDYQADSYKFIAQAYSKLQQFEKANNAYVNYDRVKLELEEIKSERKLNLFNTLNELEESYFTINNLSAEKELVQSKYLTEKKISYALIVLIVIFSVFCIVLINQQFSKKQAYNLLEYKNFLIKKMNAENANQKKDLEELNKTKDKFFSIIGHDLKNPFNSIKGFSELLIENFDEYDKEKQLKFLKIIKDSSLRATSLLNNLLLWANNQSGNIQFKPEKIQLLNQVADAVTLVKIQAVNKEIEISIDIAPGLYVLADTNMLNTIIRNLISNAIKFTKPGGAISVFTRKDKEMVSVFVRDTGIGISKEYQNRLFNLQDKSTSVGTNNEQGSGLGLTLCQDFVHQNGGELHVESEPNKGSTFYFTIPVFKEKTNKKAVLKFKTA